MKIVEDIPKVIGDALSERGYFNLTPVQKAILNSDLVDKDILVSAQTGSGKTVAFGLALAPNLLGDKDLFDSHGAPLALVIAPTRELAMQVGRELEWLYAKTGVVISVCIGGVSINVERRDLRKGSHIVVGTPGRLCDHIRGKSLDISHLKSVILDEADEMLDLGFRDDIEFILDSSPKKRRMLMFSATLSPAIITLAKNYQKDAVRINISSDSRQHSDIDYRAMLVRVSDRDNAIVNILRYHDAKNALVFCSTRASVARYTKVLADHLFQVVALSGELSQQERSNALQMMRDGRARVCIATDVAARGIDLPDLDLVIHAELSSNPETLLHRSGRTGRAGRKGISVFVIPQNLQRRAERLLRDANVSANWEQAPTAAEIIERDSQRMLKDSSLLGPIKEDERKLVDELLSQHSPENIAVGFLRINRAGRCVPEELNPVSLNSSGRGSYSRGDSKLSRENSRDNFRNSSWFSLSVGSKDKAEARWLIPMLCRNIGISRNSIGAIRVQPEQTFIEISSDGVKFLNTSIKLDRGIQIRSLNGGRPDFKSNRSSGVMNRGTRYGMADRKFSKSRRSFSG
ncbi:DEAD/DEAH box helicase [Candidatus Liberibacter americanus]|uniref:Superfamily II DNA and RNA helicase n=1 Tax=Candidatus Liberibacter americanus str. Sao Paulo TaxID=1261131 RepID=U6B6E4_9HYPH|nr:DEAD/DEAH box helicase [Candidatus Liberibacter americanus]AHA28349.1 Superfamily II DNA and RNA helicase [Candidatus Liberibacter americanus str. Sao Paulo]EMS36639.1 ATP-dependent RNA helicase protein [Candidatus Liberibacter americanus PW_SP]